MLSARLVGFCTVTAVFLVVILVVWLLGKIGLQIEVVAAAAAAFAAVASAWSSSASGQAARDAMRAISFATKPRVHIDVQKRADAEVWQVSLVNEGMFPIGHARLKWQLDDGTSGAANVGRIEAPSSNERNPHLSLDLGGIPVQDRVLAWRPGVSQSLEAGRDVFTIEYWGAFGPVGWRKRSVREFNPNPREDVPSSISPAYDEGLEWEI